MKQNHYPLTRIYANSESDDCVYAMFSMTPSDKAIVFIHGYFGDPVDTWLDFPELVEEYPDFNTYDVYFYGYGRNQTDVISIAAIFSTFIDKLFVDSSRAWGQLPIFPLFAVSGHRYDKIVIASHSLGAVVTRIALLQMTNDGKEYAKRTKLILYAPAHMGASLVDVAFELCSVFRTFAILKSIYSFKCKLLDQLSENSDELRYLRDKTQEAINVGCNNHLIAEKVIIAQYETVVRNIPFCSDPVPYVVTGATHKTVCKPRKNNPDPLEQMVDCL